jgi:hypothetical protein
MPLFAWKPSSSTSLYFPRNHKSTICRHWRVDTSSLAMASCCTQVLWMRQTLEYYGLKYGNVPLLWDNESVIKIAYNPVLHGKTKHIEIRNHFIQNPIARGDIELSFIGTKDQLADIFTKWLDDKRFIELRYELNLIDSSNVAWPPCAYTITYSIYLVLGGRHGHRGNAV